jgi:hypothetical protein
VPGERAGDREAHTHRGHEIFVAAGFAAKAEGLGGEFCAGAASGAEGPERASRMAMFRLCCLGLTPLGELVGGD